MSILSHQQIISCPQVITSDVVLNSITRNGITNYWPSTRGNSHEFLASDGLGNLIWTTPLEEGTVSAVLNFTDTNRLIVSDTLNGLKNIKETKVMIDNANIHGVKSITTSNLIVDTFSIAGIVCNNTDGSLYSSYVNLSTDTTGILPNAKTTATSANTPSTIVARDASGNFSANTITAKLLGTASGNLALTGGTLSGALTLSDGTALSPGLNFTSSPKTGLSCINNTLSVNIIGSEVANFTSNGLAISGFKIAGILHNSTNGLISSSLVNLTSDVNGILPNINTTATSLNMPSTIITRDAFGDFSAGNITANLIGHSSLDLSLSGGILSGALTIPAGTPATPSLNFKSSSTTGLSCINSELSVNVNGISLAKFTSKGLLINPFNIAGIIHNDSNGLLSSSLVNLTTDITGVLPNANTTATNINTPSTITLRDSNGDFSAGTITANLIGIASGNLASTGGVLSGPVTFSARTLTNPSINFNTSTTTGLSCDVDSLLIDVNANSIAKFTSNGLSMNGNQINSLANGSLKTDAATVGQTAPAILYQYQPRLILVDTFADGVINDNIFTIVRDNIVTGTNPNTTNATVVEENGYLQISGASDISHWSGIGVSTIKSFTYTLDYDICVDMYCANNNSTDSAAALELYQTSGYNLGIYCPYNNSIQRFTNILNSQINTSVNAITKINYLDSTFSTILFKKRGNAVQVFYNAQLITAFTFTITGDFQIRLMGYAKTSTDSPTIRFRNFSVTQYPVAVYPTTIPTTPLLTRGSGFDSIYVKDPEIILGAAGQYYLYYSGYNGSFSSGVVSLGTSLSSPVIGTRTQLIYGGNTINGGSPSVYFDGSDYWLFLQTGTNTGVGSYIQILKSHMPGSYTNFMLQGTAIAAGGTSWTKGVYDPCIVKQPIGGGLYYLYFVATCSTLNSIGYTRTIGLAIASSLSGTWVIKGQVKLVNSNIENITFGYESPNVIYRPTTNTFHLQLTGGSLGNQEMCMNYFSYDGLTFYPCNDLILFAGADQSWNWLSAGAGSWIDNSLVDGNVYSYYHAQPFVGGNYSIGYFYFNASTFFQRSIVLAEQKTINLTSDVSNILPVSSGGTGVSLSPAVGDLLCATTASTLGPIPAVDVGQVLISTGVNSLPAYSKTPLLNNIYLSEYSSNNAFYSQSINQPATITYDGGIDTVLVDMVQIGIVKLINVKSKKITSTTYDFILQIPDVKYYSTRTNDPTNLQFDGSKLATEDILITYI
jgi:hypothetical protein